MNTASAMKTVNPLDRQARRTIAARYPLLAQRNYARGKLATDPLYAGTARVLAPLKPMILLDVGCGMGLLGQYLHACGLLHGYHGIDHDERKIAAGRHAAATMSGVFQLQHTSTDDLPDIHGHVALLDVLHYLPEKQQHLLLSHLATHVAPGGVLVLRNVLRDSNWRFRATVAEEKVLHGVGWMRVAPTHYPSAEEIRAPLEAAGLDVTFSRLWGHTPFNSYLLVARHRSGCKPA